VYDGNTNALIGAEGDGVVVVEVGEFQRMQRSAPGGRQAIKIVQSGQIATPVAVDLG
jgi:hypothetical protein